MNRRRFVHLIGGGTALLAGCSGSSPSSHSANSPNSDDSSTIFVDVRHGKRGNDGTKDAPLNSIQKALARAEPGDTVRVAPGEYVETINPPRGGEKGNPITITGPPTAVLKSDPETEDVILIRRSHIHLVGLTIDGLENPDAPDEVSSYADLQLIQVRPRPDTDQYVRDIVISPHQIGNSQKALVNIERATQVEIGPFHIIGPAGAEYLFGDRPGHNGEIVYIGTSPDNLGTSWHPWTEFDETNDVRVHHIDNSAGYAHSELVNTKLGTYNIMIEYCTDGGGSQHTETWSTASVLFQSYASTIRWCHLANGAGYGIEVESEHAHERRRNTPESEWSAPIRRGGRDNAIYRNRIVGFEEKALAFPLPDQRAADQRLVCGNIVDEPTDDAPEKACPAHVPRGQGIGHGNRSEQNRSPNHA